MKMDFSMDELIALKRKKILITGASGFLGSHLVKKLTEKGAKRLFMPSSKQFDLTELDACKKVVRGVDIIIHLAGKVGGIGFNMERPGEMFYDNIRMGIFLLDESRKAGVEKFVAIGTVCSYPKFTPVPFKEDDFWQGYPEETNAPYGLAKKMLLVQAQAYRQQYGFNSIYLIPINLYGPGDNFDPKVSHVIPALIKKVFDAKETKADHIIVWGTGRATRGFLYVEDAVEGIILATEKYNKGEPVNLGQDLEISIKDLVYLICKLANFKGKVIWDKTKPDGQPRRRLDVTRAKKGFGFVAKTPFEEGLKKEIEWYEQNILGKK